ncbi:MULTISPECIES: ABC transporter ATP-binding protein [Clostridium]|uniref:ABC transporter ATP-binding protein n=1 Tax=Clostridium cadaveris TaxID=1529 RepID=A0A1I2MKB7_9CLOT|nr:ABC transporter ATP-binding protein [Clostridium cadaveris]MDU4951913.1 ABC transporter ATP-binding protein [Clostridium sp.]MDM8311241.1 ABC transporter ATP-binding protein [Clostridium cadaveris]MDY4949587.1 ABC transporter ATP-binding protein [Clostridium cadaveris]NME64223.1 ABC transporter ATP-binding protein [Clostridium cadaveris]NWK10994.1 ABC transporter ATP-binding protein [Clostridium cadaveris]
MESKILEIRGLKKNFGNKEVLRGINLEVNKGEIIGYIGPNGAGKSTTVKIILGLIEASAGDVFIFGEDIKKNGMEYKKRIGYVPEVAELYESLTAKEYLTFVGELYGLKEETSLKKAQAMMTLLGIEDCMNTRLSACSKGMKQKIVLISSLIHDPDILFLDEPLSGLDANSVMIIKELLACLAAQGKTIFYSSHIMDVVEKISHRIVLINDGVIVADGSFHELQENCKEDSLEEIFNELTGFKDHKEIAETMTSIINEV